MYTWSRQKTITAVFLAALVVSVKSQTTCSAEDEGKFVEDWANGCDAYTICFQGLLFRNKCPQGLFFNPENSACDNHFSVNCTQSPVSIVCPDDAFTVAPYPYSCTKYIQCAFGIQYESSCPQGQHFNSQLSRCTSRETALCTIESSVCPIINDPTQVVFLPSSRSCSRYYLCVGRQTVSLECAPELAFDKDELRCDREELVNCSVSVPTPAPTPPPIEFDCMGDTSPFIQFPHPTDCRLFFRCLSGVSSLEQCPIGTLFDFNLRACAVATLAECDPSIVVEIDSL